MKNAGSFVLSMLVLAGIYWGWSEYNSPVRRLARAEAKLKQMERQERRDANTHKRSQEDRERARFARPERFATGTRGKRLNHEAASDKYDDVKDWYEDKQAELEAQREEVRRLRREVNGGEP